MCNHPNREAAMVRIQGTPVPGVTTKVGSCDPCLHPLVQALNDGGITTIASCCGHGAGPGSIGLADGRWLVIANEPPSRDQTEDGLAERVRALHKPRIVGAETMRRHDGTRYEMCEHDGFLMPCPTIALLADQPDTTAGGGDRG